MNNEITEITVSCGVGAGQEKDIEVREGDSMLDVYTRALTQLGLPTNDMSRYTFRYNRQTVRASDLADVRPDPECMIAYLNATKQEGGLL